MAAITARLQQELTAPNTPSMNAAGKIARLGVDDWLAICIQSGIASYHNLELLVLRRSSAFRPFFCSAYMRSRIPTEALRFPRAARLVVAQLAIAVVGRRV